MKTDLNVFKTGPRQQIIDLERLPIPNRSLIDYEKYNKSIGLAMVKDCITLQASRGCPYHCAYCHKIMPKNHVFRSAESIFSELQSFYNIGVRRFVIIDDIFNLNIKNSTRFFQLIIKNHLPVHLFFPSGMRADLLTREYIDLMVEAGTASLALAIETASPRLQKLIGKNMNLEKFKKNIDYICAKHPQVILELFTMHGFPTETQEEAMMTLNFIKELKWVHFPYVFILKIYPNTDMEKIALENGISKKAIENSREVGFHQLPTTLPFDKSFTLKYQSQFLYEYFLSKERLLHMLPYQMKILTEEEMLEQYSSYVPFNLSGFDDLLNLVGIEKTQLPTTNFLDRSNVVVPGLNQKIKEISPTYHHEHNALKVLLLDLSQFFSGERQLLNEQSEVPLGLIYLLTYLYHRLPGKVKGKIAKSHIDFDNYSELKVLIDEFQPDVIGIRTMTIYKNFFHKTVSILRQWKKDIPIITGGPYATSEYTTILQDRNIDLVAIGEGEITFAELIEEIIKNDAKLPDDKILKSIPGIVFVPGEKRTGKKSTNRKIMAEESETSLEQMKEEMIFYFNESLENE